MFDEKHKDLTPKQEAFAYAYVETGSASEAYRRAGYSPRQTDKSIHENSSKLLTKVLPRVEQLQAAYAERHKVTIDELTTELENARLVAMAERQPAAAVSAIMAKAKLHGLIKTTGNDQPLIPPSAPAPIINVILASETSSENKG